MSERSKMVIYEITQCRNCFHFTIKLNGAWCSKLGNFVENPHIIDKRCPLPNLVQFLYKNGVTTMCIPNVKVNREQEHN